MYIKQSHEVYLSKVYVIPNEHNAMTYYALLMYTLASCHWYRFKDCTQVDFFPPIMEVRVQVAVYLSTHGKIAPSKLALLVRNIKSIYFVLKSG